MIDAAAIVPSYQPDRRLLECVDGLLAAGFSRIVVVDDGSDPEKRQFFDEVAAKEGCVVLHHPENRGKGAAVKTALVWTAENLPGVAGFVTCDSDGQHRPADCVAVAEAMLNGQRGVYLGTRDFSSAATPLRSRFGNFWTSVFFWLVHGVWLRDTQTGLRAFRIGDAAFLAGVAGDRFEYEAAVLCEAARHRVPIVQVPIETVYMDGNSSSHFCPLRDSVVICRVVLGSFFRYAGVSLSSFLLDQGLAWAFAALATAAGCSSSGAIWASGFVARLASGAYNYFMNKAFVFGDGRPVSKSAWRYVLVCVAVICASNAAVSLLAAVGAARGVSKLLVDTALYFACYAVQRRWVFLRSKPSPRLRAGGGL